MTLPRRVETFVAGYVGFLSESTAFSNLPMQDLDSPAARKNFALSDRTKQYLDPTVAVVVKNASVVVDPIASPYTVQGLGAIIRSTSALSPSVADPTTALVPSTAATGGTIPAGTYLVSYAYRNANGSTAAQNPAAPITTTGATSTITTGAAPALPSGATSVDWFISSVAGGGQATLIFQSNTVAVTGVTITALPVGTAAAPTVNTTVGLTLSGNYVPMYFLKGARALGNTRTAAKIDTTGSGDSFMNGVPGRPDATITFSLVTGAKITNKAGRLVTIESMLIAAADAGQQVVFAFIDDTTDPLQPRDLMYCFIGTANKTRALGAAVERAIDGYLSVPDNGTSPYTSIDYIA